MKDKLHHDDEWGWEEPEEYQSINIPDNPSPAVERKALEPFIIGGAVAGIAATAVAAAWQIRKRHKGKGDVPTD